VNGLACGRCDACALRKKGFAEAGMPDPTRYAQSQNPLESEADESGFRGV